MTAISATTPPYTRDSRNRLSALMAVDHPSGATALRRSIEALGWDCESFENRRDFDAIVSECDHTLCIIALDFDGACGVRLARRLKDRGGPSRVVFWSPDAHISAGRLAEVTGFGNAELLIGEVSSENLARAACNALSGHRRTNGHEQARNGAPAATHNSPPEQMTPPEKASHVNGQTGSTQDNNGAQARKGSMAGVSGSHSLLQGVILGSSPAMREVRQTIADVGPTRATVLISGPSGTGKELVARSIHGLSRQKSGPFVPVNLAAIPETLAESQLFGHEKGAFTNALNKHDGFCRAAHNGTLFLDEISEMPIAVQPKLLRFMQERTIQTLGSASEQKVDARVISAMNRDPATVVRQGHLREDLYFRLNVVPIRIPPLSERREDIEELALAFLRRSAEYHDRDVRGFTTAAVDVLSQFDWPGNVRQLENAIERVVIFCRGTTVDGLDIPAEFHGTTIAKPAGPQTGSGSIDEPEPDKPAFQTTAPLTPMQKKERETIVEALQSTDGHVTDAANLLGIGQATLYRKLKQYNISRGPRRRRKSPK